MKLFSPSVHRILDFATIVILVLTPIVAGLGGLIALVLFLLAAVHLILTLATRFSAGSGGVVSLWAHGVIEIVVAVALVAAPYLFGFGIASPAKRAYVFLGAWIFLVWLLTDYRVGGRTPAAA
jgi:hypothetical protein